MCRIASPLVTEAERKHVRRRASLVAVACFLPGRAKDLSAPRYLLCNEIVVQISAGTRFFSVAKRPYQLFPPPQLFFCFIGSGALFAVLKRYRREVTHLPRKLRMRGVCFHALISAHRYNMTCVNTSIYEGWNFNSGNYLFTTDTK